MTEVDFTTAFADPTGYEELRKHIRESTDFTKELTLILEERAEVEMNYAKLLNKLTIKANKITRTNSGTLSAAWSILCGQFDAEATAHKTAAETIIKDIQKPMKKMAEQQAKSYKLFETPVDKATKALSDSRGELLKRKKSVHTKSKDSQVLLSQIENSSNAKGRPLSDKEVAKLKTKNNKAEEAVVKSETEYLKQMLVAETVRHQHENALIGAASTVQKLEIDRINQQKALLAKYSHVIWDMTPKIQTCCDNIDKALTAVQPETDISAIAKAKGKPPQPTYQILLDSYEEDQNNAMNINQRKVYVARKLKVLDAEIAEEERKRTEVSKSRRNSTKATKESNADASVQMMHVNDTLNLLVASKYKLLASLAELDAQPKPVSEISRYIRVNKDRQGAVTSTLHFPRSGAPEPSSVHNIYQVPSLVVVAVAAPVAAAAAPGAKAATIVAAAAPAPPEPVVAEKAPAPIAASAHVEPAPPTKAAPPPPIPGSGGYEKADVNKMVGTCTALYDFTATDDDQLDIVQGETINICEKGDDGWWKGELNGRVGLFPASYVKAGEEEDGEDEATPDDDLDADQV